VFVGVIVGVLVLVGVGVGVIHVTSWNSVHPLASITFTIT
jgi:hypothetical protein